MKIYLHKKRGTKYVLLGFGKFQASNLYFKVFDDVWLTDAFRSLDMIEVAIYRSLDDDELWVRPKSEFNDGRFELVEE
jgi:hypothetical protein